MNWTYDARTGAFYLSLGEGASVSQIELEDGTVVDLGTDDKPVGVEVVPLCPPLPLAGLRSAGVSDDAIEVLVAVMTAGMPRQATDGLVAQTEDARSDQARGTIHAALEPVG